jgi:hypothetical protein
MSTNRNLLKEAIADAKTVKETAIANAKAVLEESFAPQLKSMISLKLQEMSDEYEKLEEEDFGPESNLEGLDKEDGMMDEDMDLDDLLKELNEEDEMESEEDEMESEKEGEPLDLEDMTDEDLKKMIEDVIADMVASGELEAGEGGDEIEDMEGEEVEDEEVNLDELLAEIESLDEEEDDMMYEDEEKMMEENPMAENLMAKIVKAVNRLGSSGAVEDLIKDKLPRVVAAAKREGKLNSDFELSQEMIDSLTLRAKEDGGSGDIIFKDGKIQYQPGLDTKGSAQASTFESLQTELEEAYATIETLRQDLNEINLLNAKLLYTNKIFKAKNLTENQKVKVLNMFDKAATVKETKLVYETLSEGLKETRKPIKESLGMASKTMGTTNHKQPIVESDSMVSRFQKLAGII